MTSKDIEPARFKTVTMAPEAAPWIVMVHGVSQDHEVFNRQVDAFQPNFRLLLIDLPGHGLSTDIPGPYGLREYATSIDGALTVAGLTQVHFWGTHLGAGAGLLLACEKPAVFSSLILEGPVIAGRPLPSVSSTLEKVSRAVRDAGLDTARDIWWEAGEWFAVMRARPVECRAAEQRAMIQRFQGGPWLDTGLVSRPIEPIGERLKTLPMPTLIINGEHDVAEFLNMASELADVIPDCKRTVIPDAGGFPLWEFPNRVNEIVCRFLNRHRPG